MSISKTKFCHKKTRVLQLYQDLLKPITLLRFDCESDRCVTIKNKTMTEAINFTVAVMLADTKQLSVTI